MIESENTTNESAETPEVDGQNMTPQEAVIEESAPETNDSDAVEVVDTDSAEGHSTEDQNLQDSEVNTTVQDEADDSVLSAAEPEEKNEEDEVVAENKPAIEELDEERSKLPWYVVHTYSGYEQRVKLSLEERIRKNDLTSSFGNILVPQETVVELVRGVKKTSNRKFFPGYIIVQMDLNEETWHLVSDTPRVTGFVGDSQKPLPISEEELKNLVAQIEGGAEKPRPRVQFYEGDTVKVIDGPFSDFNGVIDEVKPDKGKLRVLISIFGRNTPVELDFVQVEKA